MYPVSLGYDEAVKRVKELLRNGHRAEALLTSVFTVEKTFYRTLRQLIVSAGFPSAHADTLMKGFRGLEKIKEIWPCFDPKNEGLTAFIPQAALKSITTAQQMRNRLVHGSTVYKLSLCEDTAKDVLLALDSIRTELDNRYGYDGWTRSKVRRKSALHTDPRVRI